MNKEELLIKIKEIIKQWDFTDKNAGKILEEILIEIKLVEISNG